MRTPAVYARSTEDTELMHCETVVWPALPTPNLPNTSTVTTDHDALLISSTYYPCFHSTNKGVVFNPAWASATFRA